MFVTAVSMLLAAQAAQAAPAANTKAGVDAQVRASFARLDVNKDGFVDRAEADRAQSAAVTARQTRFRQTRATQFAQLDTNKDGSISRQEFESVGAPQGPAAGKNAWMELNDIDRNGRVALAEAVAKATNNFDRLDSNKDGTITAAELRAARTRATPKKK
jgi:Ca2+-binding EF-hand superfamily protein